MKNRIYRLSACLLAISLGFGVPTYPGTAGTGKKAPGAISCADELKLTPETASSFARITLACVHREYPNKPGHVMHDEDEVQGPRALHPSFYGCFDWHSAVHGHWMLARLLRMYPGLPEADAILKALVENLNLGNILAEAEYLGQEKRKSFERTYGWAWLLKLAQELKCSDDPEVLQLSGNLEPLVQAVVKRYTDFLPRQTYPIRRGVHPNTAFGLAFALDYARAAGKTDLESLIVERSITYYLTDEACPGGWEPDGDDFFSPCLMEADLVRRILPHTEYGEWLGKFMPELINGSPENLLSPATVSDRSDPKIVHLDGLNLSRAWCMLGIASALPGTDPRRAILEEAACLHAQTALEHIESGNYEGEHWLASFAVYLLSVRGKS